MKYFIINDFLSKDECLDLIKDSDKLVALAYALENDDIAGVGLDVYDVEPLPQDHKLRFLPNALLFPHIGYVTEENYSIFFTQMLENLESCIEGKPKRLIK